MADFIGSGWSYPVRTNRTGAIALATGEKDIEESIRLILATAPGERPMRPEFGCGVHQYVFSPADAATAGDIAYAVRVALQRWEPRIELESVTVRFDGAESGLLYIDIAYALLGHNDPRNLVFPFYVIPDHEEGA